MPFARGVLYWNCRTAPAESTMSPPFACLKQPQATTVLSVWLTHGSSLGHKPGLPDNFAWLPVCC